MARPIAVDLFAGAGGMSLGFEQAGFDVVAAVEIDPIHAATHKYNFPHTEMLTESIVTVSARDIRLCSRMPQRSEVAVVIGGPPCQGFSMMGKRALDDPRNGLVLEYVRLVAELRPQYFVFENVKGLTIGRHRQLLDELLESFSALGYDIVQPWRVLNARDYGVPQSRERLILLGYRKGCPPPSYPKPHPLAVTCADALGDLPDADCFDELWKSDEVKAALGTPSVYARELRCIDSVSWGLSYRRQWSPWLLTSSLRTSHTSISRRRFAETEPGDVEPVSRFFKLAADGVCNTLRAGTDSARGAFTSPRPIHYKYARCITVREMARLHGFPDWFRFHSTKWHGARQIGNAVPPPLARAIAASIRTSIGGRIAQPTSVLALGERELLQMDISEAAAYWGVVSPIARRNMRSGVTKRRQEDIEATRIRGGKRG